MTTTMRPWNLLQAGTQTKLPPKGMLDDRTTSRSMRPSRRSMIPPHLARRAKQSHASPGTSARIANERPRELRACLEDRDAFSAATSLLSSLVAKNRTGYYGVYLTNPGQLKPYVARVSLWVASQCTWAASPPPRRRRCASRVRRRQSRREGAYEAGGGGADDERGDTAAGAGGEVDAARGRQHDGLRTSACASPAGPASPSPITRGGKAASLGSFATAEEAALFTRDDAGT